MAFFAVVAVAIAVPVAGLDLTAGGTNTGTGSSQSGGSDGSSDSGSSNGSSDSGGSDSGGSGSDDSGPGGSGSGGSGSGGSGSGGSDSGGNGGTGDGSTSTTGETSGAATAGGDDSGTTSGARGTSNSDAGGSSDGLGELRFPSAPSTPEALEALIPVAGTVLEVTVRNLPPFLFLPCLAGVIAGADAFPEAAFYDGPDLADQVADLCARIDVFPLTGFTGSGFSSPSTVPAAEVSVDPDDVELTIEVRPDGTITVMQEFRDAEQRFALTLLAAGLLVLAASALALVLRWDRRRRS